MAAQKHAALSVHSSPSSEDTHSYRNTPGTTLTEFSPDDTRGDLRINSVDGLKVPNPPTFTLRTARTDSGTDALTATSNSDVQDPFTGDTVPFPSAGGTGPKLSPVAPAFMPLNPSWKSTTSRVGGKEASNSSKLQVVPSNTGISYLSATSVPDVDDVPSHLISIQDPLSVVSAAPLSPIGPPCLIHDNLAKERVETDNTLFSTTRTSTRYLRISSIPKTTTVDDLNIAFNVCTEPSHVVND